MWGRHAKQRTRAQWWLLLRQLGFLQVRVGLRRAAHPRAVPRSHRMCSGEATAHRPVGDAM